MKLVIETLNAKGEVIATTPVDEMNPDRAYVAFAIEMAREMLKEDGFVGVNVRVADERNLTHWMTYHRP